mgnify:FL=1|jgi:hypothetical protein|tara:strand:- start:395 stop:604 length:210 start_codon:yes stop_codon:yes gene_type:complete
MKNQVTNLEMFLGNQGFTVSYKDATGIWNKNFNFTQAAEAEEYYQRVAMFDKNATISLNLDPRKYRKVA